jgi:FlaA1/EpsC-like NDP-sugar epimerase
MRTDDDGGGTPAVNHRRILITGGAGFVGSTFAI